MTRMLDRSARLCVGMVLVSLSAGCAVDRQGKQVAVRPAATQRALIEPPSSPAAVSYQTPGGSADFGPSVGDGQTTTQASDSRSATPTDTSTPDIVAPSLYERTFLRRSSCEKPGCNSCES